jgi:c-di-GMP-binding flagellar brake protein YcgR
VEIGAVCRFRGSLRQGGELKVAGLVRNLSEGGLMMELPHPHTKGTFLDVTLRTGDFRIHVVAEVVWAGPAEVVKGVGQVHRHGLQFLRMSQDQRKAIRRFIIKRLTS